MAREPEDAGGEARAYVGLGGNLGDRLATLRSAVRALGEVADTRVVAASAVYETRPVGPSTEPFLNAAVELHTRLEPAVLLAALLAIEARHGRERRRRWDARTLDLDLLAYLRAGEAGWQAVRAHAERLTLPHPRMGQRDFVLVPLRDLVGEEAVVDGRAPREWLAGLEAAERTILRQVMDVGELLR
jgi:2-amino-4-hydroxy-6-hydroxymethyldihydropteridine diphosphokinase